MIGKPLLDDQIVSDLTRRQACRKVSDYLTADIIRLDCENRGWSLDDLENARGAYGWDSTGYVQQWFGNRLLESALLVNDDGTGTFAQRERRLVR